MLFQYWSNMENMVVIQYWSNMGENIGSRTPHPPTPRTRVWGSALLGTPTYSEEWKAIWRGCQGLALWNFSGRRKGISRGVERVPWVQLYCRTPPPRARKNMMTGVGGGFGWTLPPDKMLPCGPDGKIQIFP